MQEGDGRRGPAEGRCGRGAVGASNGDGGDRRGRGERGSTGTLCAESVNRIEEPNDMSVEAPTHAHVRLCSVRPANSTHARTCNSALIHRSSFHTAVGT